MNTATTLLADLQALRALLAQGWCQDAPARDIFGHAVSPRSRDACSWCLAEGIWRITPVLNHRKDRVRSIQDAIGAEIKRPTVAWNDDPKRTQAEVLAMLDRAIAKEQTGIAPQEVELT